VRLRHRRGALADEVTGHDPALGGSGLPEVDPAGLEEGHPVRVAGQVVAGGVEQAAEQCGAHHGLLLREGVEDGDRGPARVVSAKPQPVRQAGRNEAPGDHLVEAEVA
jgi:hypothetical protein